MIMGRSDGLRLLGPSHNMIHLRWFHGEAKMRSVEDDELGFEHPRWSQANPSIRLDTTEALRTSWSKVE
jgi:hypothetical protein